MCTGTVPSISVERARYTVLFSSTLPALHSRTTADKHGPSAPYKVTGWRNLDKQWLDDTEAWSSRGSRLANVRIGHAGSLQWPLRWEIGYPGSSACIGGGVKDINAEINWGGERPCAIRASFLTRQLPKGAPLVPLSVQASFVPLGILSKRASLSQLCAASAPHKPLTRAGPGIGQFDL